uniref:Protein FAR1-RELATED SEQUENCE n=2 Tax=Lactuca sativa TaxID=4236 RepID=A0A9R1XMK4_LACSA|nr:hypothetical protein LSAT_V11C300148790 [Lactuca sativa]KAJ0218454.1 hypothetical protein LSAT_V11C300148400 [Lactuca sativa]
MIKIPNLDMRPYKGQTFPTFKDGLTFYKEYARKSGFETRIGSTKIVKGVEGYKRRYIIQTTTKKSRKPSIRVNCEEYVRMKLTIIKYGTYMNLKKKIHIYLFIVRWWFENTGATGTDTKNFKRNWIEFIGERDADFVIDKLKKKNDYLQECSFDHSAGSNGELIGLFWADEEAKRNYSAFGDVVGESIECYSWNETILKQDFKSTWKNLMDEFHLNENNWFNEMYKMRDLWIPTYFKECTFSGLMRTTSRFEAETYFYGLLSNSDLHLIEFSTHFNTALEA